MHKQKVWLASVNYRYGTNAFLPYSVGRIWAHAMTIPEIVDQYELGGLLFDRTPVREVLSKQFNSGPDGSNWPAVLGISSYIWNWSYNKQLAALTKVYVPETLIVMGGPQIPDRSESFFEEHPYVDIIVHGEGEIAFAEILKAAATSKDFSSIPGLTVNQSGRSIKTGPSGRITGLNQLRSPYTSGVFDRLVAENTGLNWQALQETNRGCPYSCTFCDWGSATFAKVNKFPIETVTEEIQWFSKNKIELLYNCDANFGMLEQDTAIAQALVESKRTTGYPQKFRAAYAKKITDRVFNVAKMLADADMSKGATISFQSLNRETLDAVKRNNIPLANLREVFDRYNGNDIPTYTELILGLPGEGYNTFRSGIEQLLDAGQHYGLNIYPCMALKNSEMSKPDYVKEYGLKTVRVPMLLLHGIPPGPDEVKEFYDLIITTKAMSYDDWLKGYALAWIVQALHSGGLTDKIAIELHSVHGMSYVEFYEKLLAWAECNPELPLGQERIKFFNNLRGVIESGKEWDVVDTRFGAIAWPMEELAYLRLAVRLPQFYLSMLKFLRSLGFASRRIIDLVHDQEDAVVDPWMDYSGDLERYAREVVWYGRKGKKMKKVAA